MKRSEGVNRAHLKTETVQHCGREVTVISHHHIEPGSGFSLIDFEANCGGHIVESRVNVLGAEDHGAAAAFDMAQLEKDHADHTARVAAIAESRHRAASLCEQFAAKHAPEKVQEKG